MTVQDVTRILKKYIFLIIGVLFLFLVLTVVGTYLWATYAPSYLATGLVEVESPLIPKPLQGEANAPSKDIIEQAMNTQAALILSPGILQQTLDDPLVKQTNWYQSWGVDVNGALVDISQRLSASPIRDTSLVRVGFSWKNAEECATIVNVILETYYREVQGTSQQSTRNELQQYEQKSQALRDEMRMKVEEQERFRASRNIPLIEQRRAGIGDQVTALTQLLAQAMTDKDQAQSLYEMYNQPGALDRMTDTPEMRQMVDNDPLVRYYTGQLADIRIALEAQKSKGMNNRNVRDLTTRIEMVEKELNAKKRETISNTYKDMRERTRVQLDTINMQVIGIQNRLAEAKAELSELEAQLAKYLATEQDLEALRKQLETVGDYILGLRVQLDDPKLVRVSIFARATRPLERNNPKWVVNLPAGFVLGLLVGVGLAFMLEFMSTTVKTPSDVLRQLHMPLLGQIPSQDEDESSAEDMNRLLVDAPHSLLAESFRQLRANLLFCAPAEQQKSIMITSCSPLEGKTCMSVNLATSLALAGRKVLLVDANFRRPGVAAAFGIKDATEGLSNILIGHKNADSLIHATQHENLYILSSGPLPPNPSELLSSRYLKDFVARFGETYDTILFDGPPILVVSDAMVLSTAMDGVILIVRAGMSARGAIQRARDQLKRANARLLGVILNDVKITRGGYFREMYRTYYEYQTVSPVLAEGEGEGEEEAKPQNVSQ
jgi:capsular exopolysaccharide synthesis family protein